MNTSLEQFGFPTHSLDAYRYFIGDGVDRLVRRVLPKEQCNDETAEKCLAVMAEQYSRRWAENTVAYPGVPEMLTGLQSRGIVMAILSNKLDEFTRLTVSELLGQWSFDIVRGVSESVRKKPDPSAAIQIAEELGIEPGRFLYLGDTDTDMKTANAAGMYAVGALWGFREADELRANGAKALVASPEDVLKLIDCSR
jgi:phosphoglycolate phosphatase